MGEVKKFQKRREEIKFTCIQIAQKRKENILVLSNSVCVHEKKRERENNIGDKRREIILYLHVYRLFKKGKLLYCCYYTWSKRERRGLLPSSFYCIEQCYLAGVLADKVGEIPTILYIKEKANASLI